MSIKFPVYIPKISDLEKQYVNEALNEGWISSQGRFIKAFEEKFAEFIGIRNAVGVFNGTVALHLALMLLGIQKDDEVIVPTFTYVASVNAIHYVGATPVFVDSIKETAQMDPQEIEKKITPKTKAIMVVHLYGHPCDMNTIMQIAKKYNLKVIEDAAEAFGSYYQGKHVGTFGDVATFSFFGNKTITTGEGGMVVFNNDELKNLAIKLKGQGVVKAGEYYHDIIGYNYRMTNIQAAIGLAQIESCVEILKKKREIALEYKKNFQNCSEIKFLYENGDVINSFWMNTIFLKDISKRDVLRKKLSEFGIDTRPAFYEVHKMPMYKHLESSSHQYDIAENLSLGGINLPSYPGLEISDVREISSILLDCLRVI